MTIIDRRGGADAVLRDDVPAIERVINILLEVTAAETVHLTMQAAELMNDPDSDTLMDEVVDGAESLAEEQRALMLLVHILDGITRACYVSKTAHAA